MAPSAPRALSVLLISVMLAPYVQADSAVVLDDVVSLSPNDLGIEGVAIDPAG